MQFSIRSMKLKLANYILADNVVCWKQNWSQLWHSSLENLVKNLQTTRNYMCKQTRKIPFLHIFIQYEALVDS